MRTVKGTRCTRHLDYTAEAIFQVLHYQKANVGVYAFNKASVWLHENLGLRLGSRQRRFVYPRNKPAASSSTA